MRRPIRISVKTNLANLACLGDNPKLGLLFMTEPPYGNFAYGIVTRRKGRRYVILHTKGRSRRRMACARYLKIVDHYKKTGETIDDPNLNVHHKNQNSKDDRVDNLEFLTLEAHKLEHIISRHRRSILICPIDKVAFGYDTPDGVALKYPICCSHRCTLALHETLLPIGDYTKLLQWMADRQVAYVEHGLDFLEFDLHTHIGRSVEYGNPLGANEAEQVQRVRDCLLQGMPVALIAKQFNITLDRVSQLCEIGRLRKTTSVQLIHLRHLLSKGIELQSIAKMLAVSVPKLTNLMANYRYLIYPL